MRTPKQIQHAKYLQSEEWAKIRVDLFTLRGRKCERCNITRGLQIHHIHYDNWMNEEPEDLVILCGKHHNLEHDIKPKKKKKRKKIKRVKRGKRVKRVKTRKDYKQLTSTQDLRKHSESMDIIQC